MLLSCIVGVIFTPVPVNRPVAGSWLGGTPPLETPKALIMDGLGGEKHVTKLICSDGHVPQIHIDLLLLAGELCVVLGFPSLPSLNTDCRDVVGDWIAVTCQVLLYVVGVTGSSSLCGTLGLS